MTQSLISAFRKTPTAFLVGRLAATTIGCVGLAGLVESPVRAGESIPTPASVADRYCLDCHDADTRKGKLSLDAVDINFPAKNPKVWEKVIRKLRRRQMPPVGKPRPDESNYDVLITHLESSIDRAANMHCSK